MLLFLQCIGAATVLSNQVTVEYKSTPFTRSANSGLYISENKVHTNRSFFLDSDGSVVFSKINSPRNVYNIHRLLEEKRPEEYFSIRNLSNKVNTAILTGIYLNSLLNKAHNNLVSEGLSVIISTRDYHTPEQYKTLASGFSNSKMYVKVIPESLAACIKHSEAMPDNSTEKHCYLNLRGSKPVFSFYSIEKNEKKIKIAREEPKDIDLEMECIPDDLIEQEVALYIISKIREYNSGSYKDVIFMPYEGDNIKVDSCNIMNNSKNIIENIKNIVDINNNNIKNIVDSINNNIKIEQNYADIQKFVYLFINNMLDKFDSLNTRQIEIRKVSDDSIVDNILGLVLGIDEFAKKRSVCSNKVPEGIPADYKKFLISEYTRNDECFVGFEMVSKEAVTNGLVTIHSKDIALEDSRIVYKNKEYSPELFKVMHELELRKTVVKDLMGNFPTLRTSLVHVTEKEMEALMGLFGMGTADANNLAAFKQEYERLQQLSNKRMQSIALKDEYLLELNKRITETGDLIDNFPEGIDTKLKTSISEYLEETKNWLKENESLDDVFNKMLERARKLTAYLNYIKGLVEAKKEQEAKKLAELAEKEKAELVDKDKTEVVDKDKAEVVDKDKAEVVESNQFENGDETKEVKQEIL